MGIYPCRKRSLHNIESAMYFVSPLSHLLLPVVNDPGISVQPSSLVDQIPGGDVTFTVMASAECGGLTYQWFMGDRMLTDGAEYDGATENTLTVTNIEYPDDEGAYTVMVTSLFGTVESSVASLDIGESWLSSHLCCLSCSRRHALLYLLLILSYMYAIVSLNITQSV